MRENPTTLTHFARTKLSKPTLLTQYLYKTLGGILFLFKECKGEVSLSGIRLIQPGSIILKFNFMGHGTPMGIPCMEVKKKSGVYFYPDTII